MATTVPYFLHSDDNLANAFGSGLLCDALCKEIQNWFNGIAVLLQQGTPVAVSGWLLSVATQYSLSLQWCQITVHANVAQENCLSAQRWTSSGHEIPDNEVSIMDTRGIGISCPVIAGNFLLPSAATMVYDPPAFYPASSGSVRMHISTDPPSKIEWC